MILSARHIRKLKNYFKNKPINRAYLFGSHARNEANEESDVDILVELDHAQPIGMRFFTFKEELETLLGHKVDLVSDQGLSRYIRPYIGQDKILIYEKGMGR